jgi:hypothetical protein
MVKDAPKRLAPENMTTAANTQIPFFIGPALPVKPRHGRGVFRHKATLCDYGGAFGKFLPPAPADGGAGDAHQIVEIDIDCRQNVDKPSMIVLIWDQESRIHDGRSEKPR